MESAKVPQVRIESLETRLLFSSHASPLAIPADNQTSATVGAGASQFIQIHDNANGTTSTLTYTGGGSAQVACIGAGLSSKQKGKGTVITGSGLVISSITGTGASQTVLSITARGGKRYIPVNSISISANIRAVNAPGALLQGSISFPRGSAASIVIGGAQNSSITDGVERGSSPIDLVFKSLGPMVNTTLSCNSAISVTAPSWTADSPIAEGSANPSSLILFDLGSLKISGKLTNFELETQDALKQPTTNVQVGGAMQGDYFNLATGLRNLSAASMTDTSIVCDISLAAGQFPTSASQFFAPPSLISNLTLRGSGRDSFVNSFLVAGNMGTINLGRVQMSNAGQAFGLAAQTISAVRGSVAGTSRSFQLKRLTTPADLEAQKAKLRINWQDVEIKMLT